MAWLEKDNRTGYFKVALRIGDRELKRQQFPASERGAGFVEKMAASTAGVS